MAELRADGMAPSGIPGWVRRFRAESARRLGRPLETIVTLRLRKDGGQWRDEEAGAREKVWLDLGIDGEAPPCEWLDLEAEAYAGLSAGMRRSLAAGRVKVLLSHHDCAGSDSLDALRGRLRAMRAQGTAGLKLAMTCRTRPELLDLLQFAREVAEATDHGCVLSMGETGRAARVLGPALGCPLAYGYLTGGAVAPGQLSVFQLREFFRDASLDDLPQRSNAELASWAEARLAGAPHAR